jgi:hypothetical protein
MPSACPFRWPSQESLLSAHLNGHQIAKSCWHPQIEVAKALKAAGVFEGASIHFKRADGVPIRYVRLDKLLQESSPLEVAAWAA